MGPQIGHGAYNAEAGAYLMIQGWWAERKLKKFLSECNLEMAKEQLIWMFKGGIIPNELARLLDNFVASPTVDNAMGFLKYDPDYISVFSMTRKGGLIRSEYEKGGKPFFS
jgi:hypothetical protein